MKGSEAVVGHVQGRQRSTGMADHLRALAGEAGPGKSLSIRGHAMPNITSLKVTEKSIPASVSESMNGGQNAMLEGSRHHRPGQGGRQRYVTEERNIPG